MLIKPAAFFLGGVLANPVIRLPVPRQSSTRHAKVSSGVPSLPVGQAATTKRQPNLEGVANPFSTCPRIGRGRGNGFCVLGDWLWPLLARAKAQKRLDWPARRAGCTRLAQWRACEHWIGKSSCASRCFSRYPKITVAGCAYQGWPSPSRTNGKPALDRLAGFNRRLRYPECATHAQPVGLIAIWVYAHWHGLCLLLRLSAPTPSSQPKITTACQKAAGGMPGFVLGSTCNLFIPCEPWYLDGPS